MPHDVFISYASEDKITADAVCFGLEKEGIRCWIAPRDILPSDNYDDAIIQAIDNARVMVVIFSSNIFQSQYVKSEVEYAFSKNLIIAPFRIEAITPEGGLKLYLGRKHWLDAMTPPLEDHIYKLVTTLRPMLAVPAGATLPVPVPAPQVEPRVGLPSQPAFVPKPQPANLPVVTKKSGLFSNPKVIAGFALGILVIVALFVVLTGSLKGSGDQVNTPLPTSLAVDPGISTPLQKDPSPEITASHPANLTVAPPTQPAQQADNTPATPGPAASSSSWLLLDSLPRTINDYEVDPANPVIIYAATGDYTGAGGGVYKSEDFGLIWKSVSNGLPNKTVLEIAIVQGAGPVVLAAVDRDEIYSSVDGGASWTGLGNLLTTDGQSVKAFALSDDQMTIFGLIDYSGVMRSDNSGQSWTPINEGLPKDGNQILVRSIAVDPTNAQILYAGTGGVVGQGAGVYKSTDGGETWTASNKGMLDYYITAMAVDPANDEVVYAGSGSGDLFKSMDGGKSWTNLNDRFKLASQNTLRKIIDIQIDPKTGLLVLEASNSGLMSSGDGGNKWRMIGIPPQTNQPELTCMGIIFSEPPVFLMAVPGAGGWRYGPGQVSPSAAVQPTAVTTPAKAVNFSGVWSNVDGLPRSIRMLAINPVNPDQVFASVSGPSGSSSLYKSEDGGVSWQSLTSWTGEGVSAIAFSSGPGPALYATNGYIGEVYVSQDAGGTWNMVGKSLVSSSSGVNLITAPSDARVVYYVTDPGLSRSDNGGQSWQPAGDGLPMEYQTALVLSLAVDPSDKNIVYAGTGGFVGQGQCVYKSTDGGDTWSPANRGMLDYRITALAVDPHQPQVVYAGSDSGDLFKSSDGGATWSSLTEKLKVIQNGEPREVRSIQIDPGTGFVYLEANNSEVLYSSDGGGKWRALGNPPSLNQPSWNGFSMTFGEKPVMYFATQDSGVWRFAPIP